MGFQLKDGLYIINQKELEALQQASETKRRDVVEAYIEKLIATRNADQVISEKNKKIADHVNATKEDNELFQKIRSENNYLLNVNLKGQELFVRSVNVLTTVDMSVPMEGSATLVTGSKFNIILPHEQKSYIVSDTKYYDRLLQGNKNSWNKAITDSGLQHISKNYIFSGDREIDVSSANNNAVIVSGNKKDAAKLISKNQDVSLGEGDDKAELLGGSGNVDLGADNDKVLIEGGHYTVTLGQGNDKVSVLNSGYKKDTISSVIKDFNPKEDELVLENKLSPYDGLTRDSGKNARDLSRFMTLLTSFKVTESDAGAVLSFDNNSVLFENISKDDLKKSLKIKFKDQNKEFGSNIFHQMRGIGSQIDFSNEFTAEKILPGLRFEVVTAKDELSGEMVSYPRMRSFNDKELKALSNLPNYKSWGFMLDHKNYQANTSYDVEIKDSITLNMEADVKRIEQSKQKSENGATAKMWENKEANYTIDKQFSVSDLFKMGFDFKSGDQNLEVKYLFVHYESSTPRSAVLYDSKIDDLKGAKPLAGRAFITGGEINGFVEPLISVIEGDYKSNYHNGQVMAYDISKGIDRVIAQGIMGDAHKGVDDKTRVRLAFGLHNKETNKIVVTPFSNSCVISQ